jgi:hypothetical protein
MAATGSDRLSCSPVPRALATYFRRLGWGELSCSPAPQARRYGSDAKVATTCCCVVETCRWHVSGVRRGGHGDPARRGTPHRKTPHRKTPHRGVSTGAVGEAMTLAPPVVDGGSVASRLQAVVKSGP